MTTARMIDILFMVDCFYSPIKENTMDTQRRLKKIWHMLFFGLLMAGLMINSGCGVIPGLLATPTSTPTAPFTPTLAPTQTTTFTPSPTPPSTPTQTPIPSDTSAPSLTSTPSGFYYSQKFLFTLTVPPDWTVTEKADLVQFSSSDLVLFGVSNESSAVTVDSFLSIYVTLFRTPSMAVFASSTLGKKDQVTLGDGTVAVRQIVTGKQSSGDDVTMQVTCAKFNSRLYAFIFLGPSVPMTAKVNLMDGIYETLFLGKNPSIVPPLPNADSIAGKWTGTLFDILEPGSTPLKVEIQTGCTVGKVCGTFAIPELPCSGDLALVTINGKTFTFLEQNMSGGSSCVTSAGSQYIRMRPDGSLAWGYFYSSPAGELLAASAVLKGQ